MDHSTFLADNLKFLEMGREHQLVPIFYYLSSIGTRGEGYRGHGTPRSVVGTAHPDPW